MDHHYIAGPYPDYLRARERMEKFLKSEAKDWPDRLTIVTAGPKEQTRYGQWEG